MSSLRSVGKTLASVALLACALAVLAGCSGDSSDKTAPPGYYEGPKASKSNSDDTKPPAGPTGGTTTTTGGGN
jgi:hypothetical protein